MSLGKYRAIDLTILAFILVVLEGVCWFGLSRFDSMFSVSVVTIISLIVIMRWNGFGIIHAVLGGVLTVIFSNFFADKEIPVKEIWVYAIGNGFLALGLIYVKLVGKKRINSGGWWLILYALVGFISVCVGRSIIILIIDKSLGSIIQQLCAELLNFIFALIILFITNRQENVLKDQKDYFLEIRGRR